MDAALSAMESLLTPNRGRTLLSGDMGQEMEGMEDANNINLPERENTNIDLQATLDGTDDGSEDGSNNELGGEATNRLIKWEDVAGNSTSTSMKPPQTGGHVISKLGGKRELIPWVGTDPGRPANIFGVDISPPFDINNPTWVCDKRFFWSGSNHHCQKGPIYMGQFRPPGSTAEKSTQEACTIFLGTVFEGFSPSDGKTVTPMTLFCDTVCDHFIKNGMFDTMVFVDPILKKQWLGLFKNHGHFTFDYVCKQNALHLETAD